MELSNATHTYLIRVMAESAGEWDTIADFLETSRIPQTIAAFDAGIASLGSIGAEYNHEHFTSAIMIALAFPCQAIRDAHGCLRDMIVAACRVEAANQRAAGAMHALELFASIGY